MDLERMIASTPRYEGVDSINIHDATYALSTHPTPINPAWLNFTPTPQEPLPALALLSAESHCFLWLCVCVHVCVHVCACANV